MKFTQIINSTLIFNYAGKKILIDPWLAEKGALPGFGGTINNHIRNPTAELPMPINEIVDQDAVILIHDHPDHWDDAAKNAIPPGLATGLFITHQTSGPATITDLVIPIVFLSNSSLRL